MGNGSDRPSFFANSKKKNPNLWSFNFGFSALTICNWKHLTFKLGRWKLIFWFAWAPAWIFSSASKVFHRSSQIGFFFPTTKHPNLTRLAFDRAQVNNMGKVLKQFWLSKDMLVLWSCGTRFRVINFRFLYLRNKWQKINSSWRKSRTNILFLGRREPENLLPVNLGLNRS